MKNSVGNGTIEYPANKADSFPYLKVVAMLVLLQVLSLILVYSLPGA